MIDHQEEWQVFGVDGEPAWGGAITPTESRATSDVIVGTVHIWIWRRVENGTEVLLQHRAANKPTWPDSFDISVAGHIDAGESKQQTIQREATEKVGVPFELDRIEYIFSYRNFENGIKWVYMYEQQGDIDYIFNDGEVQALKWVSLDEFETMTHQPIGHKLVPHPPEYYSLIVKALRHYA